MTEQRLPVVVLISGRGSNLQSIIQSWQQQELPIDIRAVISNRPDAGGLLHAQQAGIATRVLDHTLFSDRDSFDAALMQIIDEYQPGLVVLAGFMRILTAKFVRHYLGCMINIHPALLPAFPGLNTHERALQAGVAEHGASVHFVTPEVDGGPVIIQARVPVQANDEPAILAGRVLEQEHRIFPLAIEWFATGRLQLQDNHAILDGRALPASGVDYSTLQPNS